MVQLIIGDKGKGKTKQLLDMSNEFVKSARGNIVYLDTSSKYMYELNNRIRLIDVSIYPIKNSDEFVGFICGIISQDHDLEALYIDNINKIARVAECEDVNDMLLKLEAIGEKFAIKFVVAVDLNGVEINESLKDKIVISL